MIRGILAVVLAAISYGVLSTLAKLSYLKGFGEEDASVFQIVAGFVILSTLYLFQRNKTSLKNIPKKEYLNFFYAGANIALTSYFYYISIKYIPASVAIVLLFQFVWIGVLLDVIFNKKYPSKIQIIAIILLLVGTIAASGMVNADLHLDPRGLVTGLLSSLSYALFIFFNGRFSANLKPVEKSTFMIINFFHIKL